ncbi:uncharacterized protein LOC124139633 [Haliotis rufescens]|uniref:uncharacterized protein LOC124139633 n=1 Tax=Haliotis rufescens TaxID=6454 RepID=UPI00201F76EC|nr:uncharacterized protein LOC124139633 [Haliotis rufescens]XP_048243371.1 uncharacterized protein LOC124139633 [Haliotis rufescens]
MAGPPISNIYIVNDDGIYDPSALRNLASILNVNLGTLQNCSIRVSSHGQNQGQAQGAFVDIHQQQEDRRRRRREEKERKKKEAEEKKKKMEALKKKYPFLDTKSIEQWRTVFSKSHKTDESVFKKTKAYESIRKTLDFHHVVVILGYPGEGKTTCAKYIAEDYNSHMSSSGPKYEVLNISSPAEFKEKVNPTSFQIIIVDDIFGTHTANLSKIELWVDYLDMMHFVVKAGTSKLRLVITCGRHLYEKVQQYLHGQKVFQECHVVDISADGLGLQPQERSDILRSNAGYLSYGDSANMMAYSSYSGYPLCCRLYSISKTFQNLGRVFFNDPSKYIPQEIEKVDSYDKTVYGVLVFTALNGGRINLRGKLMSELDQEMWENLKKILRLMKAPVDDLELWILQEAARILSGVFLLPLQNDSYRMIHHRITEHVLRQFSYGNSAMLIEMANPDIFMEFVRSGQYGEGMHERTFNVYPLHYDVLARRLVFDILQGKIRTASMHQTFTDEKFVKHFFEYLDRLGNLEAVYRARDEHGNSFLFWSAWYGRDLVVKGFVEKESLARMADDGLGSAEQRILALLACCYRGGVTEIISTRYRPKDEPEPVKPTQGLSALLNAMVPVNSTATIQNADEILNFEFSLLLENKALPIHFAALGNNGPAMKLILEKGAEVNAATEQGETALHLAVCKNEIEVVKFLLDKGADVNAKTKMGKTPIHDAVYYKKTDAAKLLLEKGADVNIPADDERPLLQVAVANTDIEMVKMLTEKGADVNKKGRDGWTPLHEAFYLGDTQSAEHLLDKGAHAYVYTMSGVAPLHEAVNNCDRDLIDLLLETGVSVNNSSSTGETPLHIAAKNGNLDLVKKLMDMGADINARDNNGMLPLNVSATSSHGDVMHYLMERSGMNIPRSFPGLERQRNPYGMDRYNMFDDDDDDDDYGPYSHLPPYLRQQLRRRQKYM